MIKVIFFAFKIHDSKYRILSIQKSGTNNFTDPQTMCDGLTHLRLYIDIYNFMLAGKTLLPVVHN